MIRTLSSRTTTLFISRKHCLLQCSPPLLRLLDLGSRNGVLVNGNRISSAELADGDEIRIGHTKILVRLEQDRVEEMPTLELLATPSSLQPTLEITPQPPTTEHTDSTATIPLDLSPTNQSAAGIKGYILAGEIGRGGMGVVHRARRQSDGAAVAIKCLLGTSDTPAKAMQRFFREANILASIKHPNIVELHEVGKSAVGAYIVMEMINGTDVKQV